MKITVEYDLSRPIDNRTTRFDPATATEKEALLVQPEELDEHYIDGEDDIDWTDPNKPD